jgi:hypothetical protein
MYSLYKTYCMPCCNYLYASLKPQSKRGSAEK